MRRVRFFIRQHCELLSESMETIEYITFTEFLYRVSRYDFYGYDERVHQLMFILKDMEHDCIKYPVWLGIEILEDV